MKQFEKLMKEATWRLEIARTYLEDGALVSAAVYFREAADFLERAAQVKEKALGAGGKGV